MTDDEDNSKLTLLERLRKVPLTMDMRRELERTGLGTRHMKSPCWRWNEDKLASFTERDIKAVLLRVDFSSTKHRRSSDLPRGIARDWYRKKYP